MDNLQCSRPPQLNEDQLYTVLDGLGDAETLEHLAVCSYCSKRLALMQRFDTALESQLNRFECPAAQQLTDYQLNQLDAETSARIRQHVADCPRCQQELAMLDLFLSDLPEAEMVPPSHEVIHVPRHLWRATRVELSGNLALKSLRGLGDENAHDAKAGSASLFLEAQPLTKSVLLTGQIIDEQVDWRGSVAEVHQIGTKRRVRTLDDLCEFSFELVETSPLDLFITAPNGIVLALEQLTISP